MDAAWLKEELAKKGRSQSALARFLGLDAASVNRMCGGGAGRKITADEADKIRIYMAATEHGRAAPKTEPMERLNAAPELKMLPVRFRVQAGAWLQADIYATEDYGVGPIPGDPRIPADAQWLEEVVGESMNRVISAGMLVHVLDAIGMHYSPRPGDIVVIERVRYQGREIERSLKRVREGDDGELEFVGDSSVAEFNEPIRLHDGGDDMEVRIAGWVRHAIRRF